MWRSAPAGSATALRLFWRWAVLITEDTGAERYLPAENGFRFIRSAADAETAVREVLHDWSRLSKQAGQCAVEVFDSVRNLRRILDF